jgi:hypothetical protein
MQLNCNSSFYSLSPSLYNSLHSNQRIQKEPGQSDYIIIKYGHLGQETMDIAWEVY